MTNRRTLLPLLCGLFCLQAVGKPVVAAERPVEHFSRLPHFSDMELSPDGSRIAYRTTLLDTGDTLLAVQDLESGEVTPVLTSSNSGHTIRWYHWANDDRILVSLRFPAVRRGDVVETRLLSISADDPKDYLPLYRPRQRMRGREEHLSQFQDRVISLLRDEPEHILLALDARRAGRSEVYRVNIYDASRRRVQGSMPNVRWWMADRQGYIRIAISDDDKGSVKILHRAVGEDNWQLLLEYDRGKKSGIESLRFGSDSSALYYSAYDGDRRASYKINLVTGEKSLLYHIDPGSDKEEFPPDPEYDYSTLQKSVDRALSGFTNTLISLSQDQNVYVLRSRNSTTPAAYYLGHRAEKTLELLALRYPELGAEPLYQREEKYYTARNGLEIKAYLSLPVAFDLSDGPLPTVLFPHGGPWSQQRTSFDYKVAFFTDRGYAVLNPDFRGSSGYGYEFSQASVRSWGLEMQDDLTDAAHWLVEEGIADPDRMCIVGSSYGGYAAMMALVKTPDLFSCAVSFAGVSDLVQHAADHSHLATGDAVRRYLGSSNRDMRSRSPYHNAERIIAPLLLIHGEDDRVVDVTQSRRMASRLENLGKTVEYIELPRGNHYLHHQANRHEYFRAMDEFLKRHLGH